MLLLNFSYETQFEMARGCFVIKATTGEPRGRVYFIRCNETTSAATCVEDYHELDWNVRIDLSI